MPAICFATGEIPYKFSKDSKTLCHPHIVG